MTRHPNIFPDLTTPIEHDYITDPSGMAYLREMLSRTWAKLKPPTRLTPSQWADSNRYITYGSQKGPWRTSFVPYIKEPMDRAIEPDVEEESIIAPNQSGKSEFGLCIIGYYAEHRPTDMAVYQPTADLAKKFANDKIDPLIMDTPSLLAIFGTVKSRDKKTKTLERRFLGNHLFILGANTKAAFRQLWAEVIMKDDYDAWPAEIKGEGDPGKLADARAESFPHTKKIINISTTTKDGESRIQRKFMDSSMAFYHIKCPHCGMWQVLLFSDRSVFADMVPHGRLVYDTENGLEPRWAYYECGNSQCTERIIEEWRKPGLIRGGKWIHMHPERRKHLGYQWNRLVSPFSGWQNIAAEFLAAQGDRDALQTFVNLTLAEWFTAQRVQSIDPTGLSERIEKDREAKVYEEVPPQVRSRMVRVNHRYSVPMAGFVIVISVDVQDDRLEAKVKAWGLNEESFLIKKVVLRGSPARMETWNKLDELLDEEFYHAAGFTLRPRITTIDIQGHYTDQVYAWILRKRASQRNVLGIQGRGNTETTTRMVADKIHTNNKLKVPVILVGVDTAKEIIYSRLVDYDQTRAQMHFCDDLGSEGSEVVADYFKQLTAEEQAKVLNRRTGRTRSEWRLRKGHKRNEALDLEVYNLAGFHALNLNMKLEHKKFLQRIAETKEMESAPVQQTKPTRPRRTGGDPFTDGYQP